MRKIFTFISGMLLLMLAAPAVAQSTFFRLWNEDNVEVLSFSVSGSPDGHDETSFWYFFPTVDYDGPEVDTVTFYSESAFGGFAFLSEGEETLNLGGDQLFSGSTDAPTFQSGTVFGDAEGDGTNAFYAVSAAPEPATWLMMILGFGAVGFALRQDRRNRGQGFSPQQAAA
jgi:hypothetical protein